MVEILQPPDPALGNLIQEVISGDKNALYCLMIWMSETNDTLAHNRLLVLGEDEEQRQEREKKLADQAKELQLLTDYLSADPSS